MRAVWALLPLTASSTFCEDSADAVCEAWQQGSPRNERGHAGLRAGLQLDGVRAATLSAQQTATIRASLAQVLKWPLEGIIDVSASVSDECDRVTLAATTTAADGTTLPAPDAYDSRFGDYYRVSAVSARPVYRQRGRPRGDGSGSNGWWLYFGGRASEKDGRGNYEKRWWMAGPTLGSMEAGLLAPADVPSPTEAPMWYSFGKVGGWTRRPGLTAKCNPVRRTIVSFSAVSTSCDRLQSAQIKFLPFELKTGASQLYTSLLPVFPGSGVGGDGHLRAVLVREMHVTPCAPIILLTVKRAAAQVLPSALDAECAASKDHATKRHWGCSRAPLLLDDGRFDLAHGLAKRRAVTHPVPPPPSLPEQEQLKQEWLPDLKWQGSGVVSGGNGGAVAAATAATAAAAGEVSMDHAAVAAMAATSGGDMAAAAPPTTAEPTLSIDHAFLLAASSGGMPPSGGGADSAAVAASAVGSGPGAVSSSADASGGNMAAAAPPTTAEPTLSIDHAFLLAASSGGMPPSGGDADSAAAAASAVGSGPGAVSSSADVNAAFLGAGSGLVTTHTDCVEAPWSDWTTCTATCGAGMQSRSRSIASPAQFGGKACGALAQAQVCSEGRCPGGNELSVDAALMLAAAGSGQGEPPRADATASSTDIGALLASMSAVPSAGGGGASSDAGPQDIEADVVAALAKAKSSTDVDSALLAATGGGSFHGV